MKEEVYCQRCEIQLSTSVFANKINKVTIYKFKDGYYCEKCAKIHVEEMRSKSEKDTKKVGR